MAFKQTLDTICYHILQSTSCKMKLIIERNRISIIYLTYYVNLIPSFPRPVEPLRPVVRRQKILEEDSQQLIQQRQDQMQHVQKQKPILGRIRQQCERLKAYLLKLVLLPQITGKCKNVVTQSVASNTIPETIKIKIYQLKVITFQKLLNLKIYSHFQRTKNQNVYRRLRQELYNGKFYHYRKIENKQKAKIDKLIKTNIVDQSYLQFFVFQYIRRDVNIIL